MRSVFAKAGCIAMAAACLGGCGVLDSLGLDKPTARLEGVSLEDIDLQSATLLFDVEIVNPYSVPLPLVNADYALASRGESFLDGSAAMQGTVPALGTKTVSLPARITYARLLQALRGVRPGQIVPYDATLGLSVDAPAVGKLRLPINRSGELPVPAVPKISIPRIQWRKLTLDEAAGTVKLSLTNTNSFPADLASLDYALSLGGVEIADSAIRKAINLPSGEARTIEIPLSIRPKSLGMAVFRMLTGGKADYRLGGTMDLATRFGAISLPLDKTGTTSLVR